MRTEHVTAIRVWTGVLDAAIVAATWVSVVYLRVWIDRVWPLDLIPGRSVLRAVPTSRHLDLTALIVVVWLLALNLARTYDDPPRRRKAALAQRLVRAVAMATPLLIFLMFALQIEEWATTSRSVVALFAVTSLGTLFVGRSIMWELRARWLADRADHRLLVVGSADEAAPFIESLMRHAEWGLRVVGVVAPKNEEVTSILGVRRLGNLDELPRILDDNAVDQVYMTGRAWSFDTLRQVADACEEVGVRFSMDANFLGLGISSAELNTFEGWSVLTFSSTPTPSGALLVKRWMDLSLSLFALIALSPLLLTVALLIKIGDGGPVLFTQERCGLYGRRFPMYKFRSMVVDAEKRLAELNANNEMGGPVFKMARDPRITRIGAFIRKFSIDELPQLLNIVRGEMSIVGPRPPIPSEVERYARWQMRRLSMRPGLTCIWQVSGRNQITDFDTWMKLDLQYIDNWSLFLDIKLIAKTFPVVLMGTGAR